MSEYIIHAEDAKTLYGNTGYLFPLDAYLREEVIRCRNCKFGEQQIVRFSPDPIFICLADWCKGSEGDNPLVDMNGFCAWGERREQ